MIPSLQNILDFFEKNACALEVKPEHLQLSRLCDFCHPSLFKLREKLVGNLSEPAKIANGVYHFLQEKILYEFDAWPILASETASKGTGMCFNKTNLMIALLRASRIPCVYTLFWIGKEGFRFTADEKMLEKIQPKTVHVYAEAYLGNKMGWRRYVDTSFDTRLRRVLQKQGYEPFRNIVSELPIERFATAEEVIAWRQKYKESIGATETIGLEEMEKSNRRLRELRKQGNLSLL